MDQTAEKAGLRSGDKGAHTSRTIMLEELTTLFRTVGPDASRLDYRRAIMDENCLGKRTAATRRITDQRLSELYALEPKVPLFRTMRQLWQIDEQGRPLLALLLAMARDPLLRLTAPAIIRLRLGDELGRQALKDALNQGAGSRFNEAVLDKVVRNAAASWTQSGHLRGRGRKIRQQVVPTPPTAAYALLIGHMEGTRGEALFSSLWSQVLDASSGEMTRLAMEARRLNLLDVSQSGGVVEISFTRLMAFDGRG